MKETSLFDSLHDEPQKPSGPVTCLGMTFENDEARRAHFTEELRKKLQDPEFRKIEGFPIGSDEDILALSDPPYYTACPNPFLEEIVESYGSPYNQTEPYNVKPFAFDVTEGRHTWLYKAHTYHTKVPPKALVQFIEHYTKPGDIVFDGFAGSGMTAVAASMSSPPRHVFASDLSPAASFITSSYLMESNPKCFLSEAERIAKQLDKELGWMYQSIDEKGRRSICNYVVWSDVFLCSSCGGEIVFWDAAFDKNKKKFKDRYSCPHCSAENSKRSERAQETFFDHVLQKPWTRYKQIPVLAAVSTGNRRATKKPVSQSDLKLIEKVRSTPPAAPAKKIAAKYGIPHISTGDIFRANIKNGTELGKKAKTYMDQGLLVPDELVVDLVVDRVNQDDCANGYVLDGFPRTIPQAEALDKALADMGQKIDYAIDVEVPDENIVNRMSGRRACVDCGATYHLVYAPTKEEGICDKCGGGLILRDDDKPETVLKRLGVYHDQTQPLIDYYTQSGILKEVDGTIDIDDVFAEIVRILGE